MQVNTDSRLALFLESLSEWSNYDQRSFLFADFPFERTQDNAVSYDSLLSFWSQLIKKTTELGLLSVVSFNESSLSSRNDPPLPSVFALLPLHLNHRFMYRSTTPLGLNTVLTSMVSDGSCVPLDQFMAISPRPLQDSFSAMKLVSGVGWALKSLLITPLKWSAEQLIGSSPILWLQTNRILIIIPLVQAAAQKVSAYLEKTVCYSIDRTMDMPSFRDLCDASGAFPKPISQFDAQILLQFLKQNHMAACESVENSNQDNQFLVIKMHLANIKHNNQLNISNIDKGIVSIMATIKKLTLQIKELELKLATFQQQAQLALSKNLRGKALSMIRQRKTLEKVHTQRMASLETLEGIMLKLRNSESESDVLAAYASGSNTLKALIKDKNLSLELTESTIADLQDTLADYQDIENALHSGNQSIMDSQNSSIDDEDIQRELDMLIESERLNDLDSLESKMAGVVLNDSCVPQDSRSVQPTLNPSINSNRIPEPSSDSVLDDPVTSNDSPKESTAVQEKLNTKSKKQHPVLA
ncbi:hypothetical protein BDV3_004238 [Batrachochytrium dendrobatidis]